MRSSLLSFLRAFPYSIQIWRVTLHTLKYKKNKQVEIFLEKFIREILIFSSLENLEKNIWYTQVQWNKNDIFERYIVKLREINVCRSSGTESNKEKVVRFLSCVVQHATGHPMIKLMASAESVSDQSRDPDLHSVEAGSRGICLNGNRANLLSRFRQRG